MVRRGLLLLGLVVAGCEPLPPGGGVTTVDATPRPFVYPTETKEKIIAVALEEWRRFGRGEAEWTPEEFIVLRSGTPVYDPEAQLTLLRYWNAGRTYSVPYVREQKELILAGETQPDEDGAGGVWTGRDWSAPFLAYVTQVAGVDFDDFPNPGRNDVMLDRLIQQADAYGDAAVFQPLDASTTAPKAGDVVCADRTLPFTIRLRSVDQRRLEPTYNRDIHCDLVVGIEPGVALIVSPATANSLMLGYLPLDEDGLIPSEVGDYNDPASYFVVIRNNIDLAGADNPARGTVVR